VNSFQPMVMFIFIPYVSAKQWL